jgi:hypothetical protein
MAWLRNATLASNIKAKLNKPGSMLIGYRKPS